MVFAPLGDLFEKEDVLWQDTDVKFWIQEYLRRETSSDAVYCQSVSGDVAVVRVGSPALYQSVCVLEPDVKRELKQVAQFTLKRMKITL